jgi:hypothetical protein
MRQRDATRRDRVLITPLWECSFGDAPSFYASTDDAEGGNFADRLFQSSERCMSSSRPPCMSGAGRTARRMQSSNPMGTTGIAGADDKDESDLNSCSADLTQCFTSSLRIPGEFTRLVITLRRDASTIGPGAKIANAQVFYAKDGVNFVALAACTSAGPAPGQPCIAQGLYQAKRSAAARRLGRLGVRDLGAGQRVRHAHRLPARRG